MVVATRTLTFRNGNEDRNVAVRIFAPEQEQSRAWSCAYEIDWPEGTRKFAAYGVDAVQAIELALRTIGAEIYTSDYHKSNLLSWEKPGQGYGFPVPISLRDLLVGDDARFF
jgi:hypothetical protein